MSFLKKLKSVLDASAIFTTCFLISDIITIAGSFLLAYWLRVVIDIRSDVPLIEFENYLLFVATTTLAWIFIFWTTGLYRREKITYGAGGLYKIIGSISFGIVLIILYFFFSDAPPFSRLIIVYAFILSIILVPWGRFLVKMIRVILRRRGIDTKKMVIVGNGAQTIKIAQKLNHSKTASGFKIIGVISEAKNKKIITENGFKFLGSLKNLKKILDRRKPDTLLFTAPKRSSDILNLAEICHERKITFRFIPDIPRLISHYSIITNISGMPPVFGIKSVAISGWGRIAKRAADIIVSLIVLIITSPVLLITALVIKLDDFGPVFYKQKRVGREGKIFEFYKFRSMRVDADKITDWTVENDSRITRIGKIIRGVGIDELPQLINVLKGKMSVVGPRPEEPQHVEKFSKKVPRYTYRHRVKGGITGWSQVNGLRGDTSIEERAKYDLYYIENWSLIFDLKIILLTIKTILFTLGHTN